MKVADSPVAASTVQILSCVSEFAAEKNRTTRALLEIELCNMLATMILIMLVLHSSSIYIAKKPIIVGVFTLDLLHDASIYQFLNTVSVSPLPFLLFSVPRLFCNLVDLFV